MNVPESASVSTFQEMKAPAVDTTGVTTGRLLWRDKSEVSDTGATSGQRATAALSGPTI